MIRFTVTVVGDKRVLGNFKRLEFNLLKKADNISYTIAKRIERRAKERLQEGDYKGRHMPGLIAGTQAMKTKEGQWIVISQGFDEKGVDYAPFVEYGTRGHWIPNNPLWGKTRMHPGAHADTQGYFRQSINQTKQEVKGIGEENVKQGIKESGFK